MRSFSVREHSPSILVASLSAAFGVALLQVTGALGAIIAADDVTGNSQTAAMLLGIAASIFIIIAVYVGAIVTANTFATIIAGRTRTIALLRLVGATATSQRKAVATEGLWVGIIGAVIGAIVGTLVVWAGVTIAVAVDALPEASFTWVSPALALPVVGVVLTTWLASWVGARRVLDVSPIQATGAAVDRTSTEIGRRKGRNVVSIVLFIVGTALLVLGMVVGLKNPEGVLIGVVGGVISFTGVVLGAQWVMPPVLNLVGRMLGRSAASRLAAGNAVRYPERSSRTTIGLVIGVTLITMFAVVTESFQNMMRITAEENPEVMAGTDQVLTITVTVFSVLMGFSALIAAVGMVNNLSLSIVQRTRELGLLRALGFTVRQLRRMVLAESAQLTIAAVVVGLVLGIFYGWAGAQAVLGTFTGGFVMPAVPIWLLAGVAVSAALLTVVASIAPTKRATSVAPVVALAVD